MLEGDLGLKWKHRTNARWGLKEMQEDGQLQACRGQMVQDINTELLEEREAAATTSASHPAQTDFKKPNNHPHTWRLVS